MLGHRPDGKKVKNIPGFFRIIPMVMKRRSDAQVYFKQDISLRAVDKYIAKKAKQGVKITYTNVLFACIVRLIKERPLLNHFVMNGTTYQHNDITVTFAIKKDLSDDGEETTVKINFKGDETIFEVKEIMSKVIRSNKSTEHSNETDGVVKVLSKIPDFALNFAVRLLKVIDYYGLMPKAIIKASPFHSSAFFINIASLGVDALYHHIYDFGTTGMFICMGQPKFVDKYDEKTKKMRPEKSVPLAYVCDERICDGYYFVKTLKMFEDYMAHPELLEQPLR